MLQSALPYLCRDSGLICSRSRGEVTHQAPAALGWEAGPARGLMGLPTFPAKVRPRRQSGQPAHVSGRRSQEVGTRGALRLFRTDGPTPRGKGYIGGGGLRGQ